ncbi:hypothetical protein RE432_09430 [Pusillimonas sp. SM2304]|nr:hypothetical protein [Pusillimonas sp. SM2304]MDS1140656.1 hypothetical protein [Pusillimonas sp. SM2304]
MKEPFPVKKHQHNQSRAVRGCAGPVFIAGKRPARHAIYCPAKQETAATA